MEGGPPYFSLRVSPGSLAKSQAILQDGTRDKGMAE